MKAWRFWVCPVALALPLTLSGCSLFPTTRKLPVPKTPALLQTTSPQQLIEQIGQRWNALNTLTATIEIQATELKSEQGLAKDFPSCRGYIVMRKPNMLRVAGTYFGAKIFDMASDGDHFTLVIPPKDMVIKGSNTVTKKLSNPMLNLRPNFFLDAIVVRGLDSGDEYMVTNDTETIEDAAKKHLYTVPEYVLNVMRLKTGSEHVAERVITIHRDDLLPYDQEIYDKDGNLETQIAYSNYAEYSAGKYPSKVVIKRPLEGIQLVLTVEQVQENMSLPADEFQVRIPPGAQVQNLQ